VAEASQGRPRGLAEQARFEQGAAKLGQRPPLAGLGTGVWDSTDDLRETWNLDREFRPDESDRVQEQAGASYALWQKGVERAKDWAE